MVICAQFYNKMICTFCIIFILPNLQTLVKNYNKALVALTLILILLELLKSIFFKIQIKKIKM